MTGPEHFLLEPRDWVPNNPRLPVLLYRRSAPNDEMRERMRNLDFPESDPVTGAKGSLAGLWRHPS